VNEEPTFEMACYFTGAETDAAVQIEDPMSQEIHWIPLSQVHRMTGKRPGEGTILMNAWIAKKKGLFR
jgi:hypothetical protein